MSLGLGDLKKRTSHALARETENRTEQTARPWDVGDLACDPKSRKKIETVGAVMNDDWSEIAPSIQFETFGEAKLRAAAIRLEAALKAKIKRATTGPLQIFKTVKSLVQK